MRYPMPSYSKADLAKVIHLNEYRMFFKDGVFIVPRSEFWWACQRYGTNINNLRAMAAAEALAVGGRGCTLQCDITNLTRREYVEDAYKKRAAHEVFDFKTGKVLI